MQKIILNVIPDGIYPRVYVNQFDIGRQFQITFKEDLIPYAFPNGVTFKINGRKADNHTFEYTESDKYDETHYVITKSGSGESLTITISTTEQMTAAAGDAEVQLTFKDSVNRVLGTLNFILAVQERPASVGDPSESDLPDIVRSVNGITPDADGDVQLGATGSAAIGAANISPVEQTRTMTSNHAAGTHVYVAADDQRYLVGSNPINAGATLTPGTNATSRSVDQDIEQLNSDLASVPKRVYGHFFETLGSSNTYTFTETAVYVIVIGTYGTSNPNAQGMSIITRNAAPALVITNIKASTGVTLSASGGVLTITTSVPYVQVDIFKVS